MSVAPLTEARPVLYLPPVIVSIDGVPYPEELRNNPNQGSPVGTSALHKRELQPVEVESTKHEKGKYVIAVGWDSAQVYAVLWTDLNANWQDMYRLQDTDVPHIFKLLGKPIHIEKQRETNTRPGWNISSILAGGVIEVDHALKEIGTGESSSMAYGMAPRSMLEQALALEGYLAIPHLKTPEHAITPSWREGSSDWRPAWYQTHDFRTLE
jgi:hypothetical protein